MELTKEAQDLINKRIDKKLEEAEDLIKNLKWWKSTILVLLGIFGLTSIGGFFTYKSYLDSFVGNRISERFQILDDFQLGISFANQEDWSAALYLISNSWEKINAEKIKVDDELREYYFENLLWIISSMEVNGRDKEPGENHWNRLQENIEFQNYNELFIDDVGHNESMAFCYLKYERDVDKAIKNAEERLIAADSSTNYFLQKAAFKNYLSIIEFLKGNNSNSCEYVKIASEIDPEKYLLEDNLKYYKSFENSIRSDIWELVYSRQNNLKFNEKSRAQFHSEYRKLLEECN